MVDSFSQLCRESIGEYVYALVDPRATGSTLERVFYVGKGKGDRCHAHARDETKDLDVGEEQLKLSIIRAVRAATGAPPPVFIVAHGLKTEEALRLEAILIATLDFHPLTNAVRGQGDRDVWLPADDVDARYAQAVPRSAIKGTILLVSLNGGVNLPPYTEIKSDPETVRQRTLAWWPIPALKATRVDLVVGVYRGLTRCAFAVLKDGGGNAVFTSKPPSNEGGRSRVRFEGELLSTWPHLLRRIEDDQGSPLTIFPPQSACRFVPGE